MAFLAVLAVFGVIILRLWSLQFAERERFLALAQRNYLRTIEEPALRGRIFDRHGRALAENVPVYDLVVNWVGVPPAARSRSLARLAELLREDPEALQARLKTTRRNLFWDRTLNREIDFDQVVAVREAQIPGVEVRVRPMRHYPFGPTASHLIGYLGEINENELQRCPGYTMGDWIGKLGLERRYEVEIPVLKGKDGYRKVQVFANGLVSGEIPGAYKPSAPGRDVWTTLDADLQLAAERVLGGSPGAIVAMDPRTGDILAMVSHPTFDPNVFVRSRRVGQRAQALRNQFNVALNGVYAFGSVFKTVLAIAALEEGVVKPEDTFHCTGRYKIGEGWKHCHIWWKYQWGHGDMDLVEGLQRSCDVYFYHVGLKLGQEKIIRYAREVFGLIDPPGHRYRVEGQESLFTLVGENPDPGKALKSRLQKGPSQWFAGDTLNLSIGQGELAATPLQVTVMTAVAATGGMLSQPRLVSRITEADGTLWKEFPPAMVSEHPLKPETVAVVKEGLRRVVNHRYGTAYDSRVEGLDVLGKTGTAEKVGQIPDAWYACFAPGDDPEIAITVAVLRSGHGGDVAAPMAQQLLQTYFAKRLQKRTDLEGKQEEARL